MAQQEHDTAEGRLRVRGRVRHVEMDAEIQDVGSEIPVLVDGGDSHVSHYWQNHLSSCFPLGRRHCTQLSQEAYCILSGDLCRERGALPDKSRACVLPTEDKCQDRLGTALRGARRQHRKY